MKKKEIRKAVEESFKDLPDFITKVGPNLYEVNSGSGFVVHTDGDGAKMFIDALQDEVKKNLDEI